MRNHLVTVIIKFIKRWKQSLMLFMAIIVVGSCIDLLPLYHDYRQSLDEVAKQQVIQQSLMASQSQIKNTIRQKMSMPDQQANAVIGEYVSPANMLLMMTQLALQHDCHVVAVTDNGIAKAMTDDSSSIELIDRDGKAVLGNDQKRSKRKMYKVGSVVSYTVSGDFQSLLALLLDLTYQLNTINLVYYTFETKQGRPLLEVWLSGREAGAFAGNNTLSVQTYLSQQHAFSSIQKYSPKQEALGMYHPFCGEVSVMAHFSDAERINSVSVKSFTMLGYMSTLYHASAWLRLPDGYVVSVKQGDLIGIERMKVVRIADGHLFLVGANHDEWTIENPLLKAGLENSYLNAVMMKPLRVRKKIGVTDG